MRESEIFYHIYTKCLFVCFATFSTNIRSNIFSSTTSDASEVVGFSFPLQKLVFKSLGGDKLFSRKNSILSQISGINNKSEDLKIEISTLRPINLSVLESENVYQ
jgi:hypothetical protein